MEIVGKTIEEVKKIREDELHFVMTDGTTYKMHHYQDCCESVIIDYEKSSKLEEFAGKKIEAFNEDFDEDSNDYGSTTTTEYTFVTDDKTLRIVWEGESNGYYSETPDFEEITD